MKMFVRLLTLLTLMGQARADIITDIINPPSHFKGTVGYVQANHFVLVNQQADYLRVFLKPGKFLPPSIVPGMLIEFSAREDDNQVLRLESIDGVQTPDGQMVPVVVPGESSK